MNFFFTPETVTPVPGVMSKHAKLNVGRKFQELIIVGGTSSRRRNFQGF